MQNEGERITYFGETNFRNQQTRFGIKTRDRTRHMYVVGKSGVGKSTLLENMAIQDIQNGEGVAVLDPHGSFAEKMLDYIPEHRIKDVVYFAPFDLEHPVSFNMLEDIGEDKRHFVASGLMSTFKKIWVDAWSARMEYILNNILLALLEYPDATLLGVNRMLSDKAFRKKVVASITDPSVKAFWTDEFEKYGERYMQEAGAAIQNKIGQFTANPLIRNIIGQPKSSFDVRDIMDNKKILIVNLSKGRIGEQNTSLLGSMIITKIYIAAMSRADVSYSRMADLPPFYFYVDEFQSFANESFANILSEARKYKLALIIAHQYIAQMEESVRDAVFGNVGTSISFRVGPLDAELLEKVYAPQFTATDLINLGMAQIYLSLMINDIGSPPFSAKTLFPIQKPAITYRNDVIEWTRANFAKPKDRVEENIAAWFKTDESDIQNNKPAKPTEKKPYVPVNKDVYEKKLQSTNTSVEKVIEVETQKPIQPKTHNPFKKIFEKTDLKPEEGSVIKPSPELSKLLDSIDSSSEKKEKSFKPVPQQKAPFTGEKTLSETVPPVKHAERGPTEAHRNLLKEALLKATSGNKTSEENIVEIPLKQKQEDLIQEKENTNPQEISHKDLKKILE
ncbi:MAG: type IV secretion system DNA-binding domain-containing protein [Candidatus Pacebacteria bacterium]|nr:type IV secretion system DNA-binding domain-containing protein [Candidatus Paceibacterota bacterium]